MREGVRVGWVRVRWRDGRSEIDMVDCMFPMEAMLV